MVLLSECAWSQEKPRLAWATTEKMRRSAEPEVIDIEVEPLRRRSSRDSWRSFSIISIHFQSLSIISMPFLMAFKGFWMVFNGS